MALVGTGVVVAGALAARGDGVLDTTLVSRASGVAGAVGDANSFSASISANGRYVAFESRATNLYPASNDAVQDVFVRDLATSTITLVSRASGATGAVGDGDSGAPSISPDGRYVAFQSDADNLDTDSNDAVTDIFVRDLQANTTRLVSRATNVNGAVGDDASYESAISANGHYVSFVSEAANLDPESNDAVEDVFVRDLVMNTTTLVSRASGATGVVSDGNSGVPSISADGRRVAFQSNATNLGADANNFSDVFVRDLQANATTLASRASGVTGAVADAGSVRPAISADGGRVAFDSQADNLDSNSIDMVAEVFVRDLEANATTLVSRAGGATGAVGNNDSFAASPSADGRYIAFQSSADNLDSESNDAVLDVFVRDLQANTTTLASRPTGVSGAVGDGDSSRASISDDGRRVAFASGADNLDAASNDAVSDIFTRELSDPVAARCAGRPATMHGSRRRDVLRGTRRRDVIAGLRGNDVIRGLGRGDVLCGGKGRDRLLGGRGRDRLLGQAGNDSLRGGRGRDLLKGGPGRDRLLGGPALDLLRGGPGRDRQRQ